MNDTVPLSSEKSWAVFALLHLWPTEVEGSGRGNSSSEREGEWGTPQLPPGSELVNSWHEGSSGVAMLSVSLSLANRYVACLGQPAVLSLGVKLISVEVWKQVGM